MAGHITKFVIVSALAAVFSSIAVYLFQVFADGKFDPLWIGGIAVALAFIYGYLMDASVKE